MSKGVSVSRRSLWIFIVLGWILACMIFAWPSECQTTPDVTLTGSLAGASGMPVPNATITLTPSQTFFVPYSQTPTLIDNTGGSTAPTGACTVSWQFYTNYSTGKFYQCLLGVWTELSTGGAGSGTVTSFTAPAGAWPAWLVPTVTNSTSTPSLSVAANAIPNSALANSAITINGTQFTLGSSGTLSAAAAAGSLTGATLASNVVNSSLTSTGTITSGVWQATPITNYYLATPYLTFNGVQVQLGASGAISTMTDAILSDGYTSVTPNVATVSSNFPSPTTCNVGSIWDTPSSSAVTDSWCWTNTIGSGSGPTSQLDLAHSGSSGAATVGIPYLTTIGSVKDSALTTDGYVTTTAGVLGSLATIPVSAISGTINATQINGAAVPTSSSALASDSSGHLIAATAPSVTTLTASTSVSTPKFIGSNTASCAVGPAAGTGATCVCATNHICTSNSGVWTVTTGTGTTTGTAFTVTLYGSAQSSYPNCQEEVHTASAQSTVGYTLENSTGFSRYDFSAPVVSTAYTVHYACGY
jgi:hypothetical protein